MSKFFPTLLIALLLHGCASAPPFNLDSVEYGLTVPVALQSPAKRGAKVLWGGKILSSKNYKDHTRLEILAYPVDAKGYISTQSEPLGRFWANHSGYLETAEYAPERWLSLVGIFSGTQTDMVGNAPYTFPLVEVRQIHLWSATDLQDSRTRFHFGIGVTIH